MKPYPTVLMACLLVGASSAAGYLLGRDSAASATGPSDALASPAGSDTASATALRSIPVEVAAVAPEGSAGDVTASGAVRYRRELPLGFKVAGVVRSVAVDVGDRVAAGALLATLDPTEVSARVADARAMLANARQDYERTRTMVQREYMAPAALDRARMELDRAQAAVAATAFDAARAVVRAPVAGVVLARQVEPGQVAAAGSAAVLLGDLTSGFVVDVPLADSAVKGMHAGDTATLLLGDGSRVAARVARIAAMADPATGAFDVELAITEPNAALRSGMIAKATIRPTVAPGRAATSSPTRLAVPAMAILEGRGDRAAVYRIDRNGRAEHVRVRIAAITGDSVTIDQGLVAGDRVVTSGAAYLRHGQPVTIVAPAAG